MNKFILDFSGIKSLLAMHAYFKEVFNLPDYYGHNMDAFPNSGKSVQKLRKMCDSNTLV